MENKNTIIQQLKNNEKPFGLMSEEMQSKMRELALKTVIQFWNLDSWDSAMTPSFSPGRTYRLRADYEDEPEIVEYPIGEFDGRLKYKRNLADGNDFGIDIDMASRNPDFIGFTFEDGGWYDAPIKPVGPDGKLWSGNITVDDIVSGRVKILDATHVLFRRKKKG